MKITFLTPKEKSATLEQLLSTLIGAKRKLLSPFATEACEFVEALSKAIFAAPQAKQRGDLQALAFFLRAAEINRLKNDFQALQTPQAQLTPRGLAFHVPPANVDPMFVYSWIFSLLIGNRNIIRLSANRGESTEILLKLLAELLASSRFKTIAQMNWFISYGHEEALTAGISNLADIRIIWGGDATINTIRRIPLSPHAKEMTFADRFSFCLIDIEAYLQASDETRQQLANKFFNDAYWFDQMGCSSPRLVVWAGNKNTDKQLNNASETFFNTLRTCLDAKNYHLPTAALLNKTTFAQAAAISRPLTSARQYHPALHVLRLDSLVNFSRLHCGAGLFFEVGLSNTQELANFIVDKDQTLTYFGCAPETLHELSKSGLGVDRIVPIGSALQFNRYWDGYDLLLELAKYCYFA